MAAGTSIYNDLYLAQDPLTLAAGTTVGGQTIGGGALITATTTLAVTTAMAGKSILLSLSGGFTSTLPAATGSGLSFDFRIGIVSTSGYVIATDGTAVYKGWVHNTPIGSVGGDETFSTTTLKNITLNGTTQGGLTIGDYITVRDVAANVWMVNGFVTGSGTLATPFS